MPTVIFRQAKVQDLERILEINQSFVPHVGSVDSRWLESYLKKASYFFVAETENQIAAFLIAMLPDVDYQSENFLWFQKNYDEFIYVDRIAVGASFHGQGLGRKFYEHLFSTYAGKVPRATCEVHLRPHNPESLEFHRKIGFVEVGQQETKGGQVRVSLMARELR